MTKPFAILLLLCTLCTPLFAQRKIYTPPALKKDTSTFWIFNDVTIGPYFTGGYSRQNQGAPEGWHSASRFAFVFGATADFSISPWLGFDLGLFYDSRDLYLGTNSGDTDNIDLNIGYIAIQPSIRIGWLLVGLAFDLPMAGGAEEVVSQFTHLGHTAPYHQNLNAATSDLSTLTELRGTISIPILQGESGIVHAVISANWPLAHAVQGTSSFDTTGHFSAMGRGPLPTVEAGISYQFDILH